MQQFLLLALIVLLAMPNLAVARRVCKTIGSAQLQCEIRSVTDCLAIEDYPYARNLYCPASFNAVNQVFEVLQKNLGKKHHIQKRFTFYQTRPTTNPNSPSYLDPAQTQISCMQTKAPWNQALTLGAGKPLCDLIAYVSSIGPAVLPIKDSQNPLPSTLRDYPQYFSALLDPATPLPLTEFQSGGGFDPLVRGLGREGYQVFTRDDPSFSNNSLYSPSPKAIDPNYQGISGGGGAGWGGEIVLNGNGTSRTLLAFGGGGGGGLTSSRNPDPSNTVTALGAGGGGGMQLANDFRHAGTSYKLLGLGAGTSSNEGNVQYSYYQPQTGTATHNYDNSVVTEYHNQLLNLFQQLTNGL